MEKKLGENDTFNVEKDVNDIAKCLLPHILMHTKSTHTLVQIAGKKNSSFHIPNVSLSNLTFFLVKKGKPIRMSSLLFAKTVSKRDNVMDCIGLKLSESDTLIKSVCARKNVLKNILFCLHIHSSFEVC